MNGAGCTLEVATDAGVFARLAAPWDELAATAPDANLFLTRAWVATWWDHFGAGRRRPGLAADLHVVVVRRGAEVVAIMPLLAARLGVGAAGFRMVVGIGHENADYGGALVRAGDDDAMAALLDHLASELGRGRTVVDLARLPDTSWFARAVRERFGASARYRLRIEDPVAYPVLDLSAVADPTAEVRRLEKRNDVLRRARRLAERGTVEFTFHRPGRSAGDLAAFLRLHDLRWAGRAPTGPFASPLGRAFIADVSAALDEVGLLRISLMSLDGVPFAGRFGAVFGDAYLGLKSGWDPALASFGPGQVVVGRILAQLVADGVPRFEFMRGAGPHKAAWTDQAEHIAYWSIGREDRLAAVDHRALWLLLRTRYRSRSTR